MTRLLLFGCVLIALCEVTLSDGTTEKPTTEQECNALNKDCKTCLTHAKCLWCEKPPSGSMRCTAYPVGQLIPKGDVCPLSDARWGVCWLNYKAMIISMAVIAGVILLSVTCCCVYCCCCRNKAASRRRYQEEDARIEREREERESRNAERRAERQTKYDDIRRKYGLTKEDGYQRFENE